MTLSLANELMSVPAAYRLYLPEDWASDRARRRVAGVPDEVVFKTKTQIALDEIDGLLAEGVAKAPIVMDAGYGRATELRDAIAERGMQYVAAIREEMTVQLPGQKGVREHIAVGDLARELPKSAWRSVWWRHGTKGEMRSRFALLRVRAVAKRETGRREERRSSGYLPNGPPPRPPPSVLALQLARGHPHREDREPRANALAGRARLRARELGLDHYEGEDGSASIITVLYASLPTRSHSRASSAFPPHPLSFLRPASLPAGFRPRGSPSAA